MAMTTQGAWGTLCKCISTIAFTQISTKQGDKTEQNRACLEVVITTEQSATEFNSAKRGKNSLAFEEDIDFKKCVS